MSARKQAEKERKDAEALLLRAKAALKDKRDKLNAVLAHVQRLRTTYESSLAEKAALQGQLEQTSGRMTRADRLTTGLADETVRWKTELLELDKQAQARALDRGD